MLRNLLAVLCLAASAQAGLLELNPQVGSAGDITGPAHAAGVAQSGVARLAFSNGILCSGVAIAPTVVLTAVHCIGGAGNGATAAFSDSGANSATFNSSSFLVHPGWTGNVSTGIDLALIYLTSPLASWVSLYSLYTGADEVGQTYQVAGWGEQSSNGLPHGSIAGAHAGLKVGNNLWDSTFAPFDPVSPRHDILVSDFDDGTPGNNSWLVYFPALGLTDTGVANESTVAPGDSGGPSFLNGRVAGITSFAASFTSAPNGSFGEFNGMTRISSHIAWLDANAGITSVPEPATFGLAGFALYCLWARKRRSPANS